MEVPLVSFWSTDGASAGGDFICPAAWVMRNFLSSEFSSSDFSPSGEPPLFILKKEKSGITQSSLSYISIEQQQLSSVKKKTTLVSLHWTLLQWTAGFGRPRLSSALASGRPGQVISSTYHCVIAQREMYRSHVTDTRYKIFDMTLFALHGNCRLCGFRCNFYGKQLKKNQENSFFFPIQIPISFCGKKSTFKTLGKWQNIKLLKIYCTVILELVPITHAATPEQGFRSVSSSLSYVCNLTNNLGC